MKGSTMKVRRSVATLLVGLLLLVGGALPAAAQEQDGLVNVMIGDVTILEEVDVAVAASIVANLCAIVDANVALLAAQGVDESGTSFTCDLRGRSGRTVAITDNEA